MNTRPGADSEPALLTVGLPKAQTISTFHRVVVSIALLLLCSAVYSQPRMDTIVVTAIDGGPLRCFTPTCESVLGTIGFRVEPLAGEFSIDDNELQYDRKKFCDALKSKRPQGCTADTRSDVPFYNSYWQGNGCGPSDWGDWTADILGSIGRYLVDNQTGFTGDTNMPFPGVSFADSCNAHDACYTDRGVMQGTCDVAFFDWLIADSCG